METRINGRAVDITLDTEKNVGDVLTGLEQWLGSSGHRLSGLAIDGQNMDISSLENAFVREIENIRILDIYTTAVAQLSARCLFDLLSDINEYENIKFEDKNKFFENWKQKPQANFAAEQLADIYNFFVHAFLHGNITPQVLRSITEERLREIEAPQDEFKNIKPVLDEICERLINLPLDIQMGKDAQAAQTIQLFSGIAEKIIRTIQQLDVQGYSSIKDSETGKPVHDMINEFNSAVRELLDAYERGDTVLVGDLAEYEMAPRLMELYNVILNNDRGKETA